MVFVERQAQDRAIWEFSKQQTPTTIVTLIATRRVSQEALTMCWNPPAGNNELHFAMVYTGSWSKGPRK